MKLFKLQKNIGQTILEYTAVLGLIAAVTYLFMSPVQRATQGFLKITADQIGNQQGADQVAFDIDPNLPTDFYMKDGYLVENYTRIRGSTTKNTRDRGTQGLTYEYGGSTTTTSNALIELGFTEDDPY